MYFLFQRGSGFQRQTDGRSDGQQYGRTLRHDFSQRPLQAFHEPEDHFVEAQTWLDLFAVAGAAPREGPEVNGNMLPGDGEAVLFPGRSEEHTSELQSRQ